MSNYLEASNTSNNTLLEKLDYDEYEGNQDDFEQEPDGEFNDDWKKVEIKTENDAESYDPVIKSEKTKISRSSIIFLKLLSN